MTRRVARPTLALLMTLTLLPPLLGPGPLAQEATPPPASPGVTANPVAPAPGPAYVLSLQDALKAALENNLNLAVRSYDPLRSETQVIVAESAFDPTLTGTAISSSTQRPSTTSFIQSSKTHEFNVAFDDPVLTGGRYRLEGDAMDSSAVTLFNPFSNEWDMSWKASIVQPLLRNFGIRHNKTFILEARNLLGISRSQFRQSVMDTLSATEKAYWDLNFSLMNLKTSQAALKLAQDFLEQNRIKVRVGTLAPIEITQADAQVADRDEAVIVAESLVRSAEDALRGVMNVPKDSPVWSQPIQPSDPLPLNEVTPVMDQAVSTALSRRPDLEQARLDVGNKEADLAWRRNLKRWDLNLTGEYGKLGIGFDEILRDAFGDPVPDPLTGKPVITSHGSYGDSYRDLRRGENLDWRVSLALGIPIGNRQAEARFTDAEYALSQSKRTYDTFELTARVQVRDAVRAVETTLKRVRAAQVNVRLQKEKLSAEQKKFENGMSTSFQVLQFQTDLFAAESRENLAMVDYNKALVELERVQGTLLEARRVEVPDGAARRTVPYRPRTRVSGAPGGESRPAGAPSTFDMAAVEPQQDGLPDRFEFEGGRLVAKRAGMPLAWDESPSRRSGPAAP